MKKLDSRLNLLKLFACFAVVGLHVFSFDYNSRIINYIHYIFGFAVPVFFMVNGYLILNKKNLNYCYVLRKIVNIIALVFSWNIIICFAKVIFHHTYDNVCLMTLKSLVQIGPLWHFWFLGAMIITYSVAPIIYETKSRYKKGYIVILLLFILICATLTIAHAILGKQLIEDYYQTFRIWTWILYFVLGGFIKDTLPKIDNAISMKAHIAITACLIIMFPIYQVNIGYRINAHDYYIDPVFLFEVLCLMTCIMRIKIKESISNIINAFSSLSMGCYIIHPFLLRLPDRVWNYEYIIVPFFLFPVIIVIAFVVTKILYRFKVTRFFVSI